MPLYRITLVFTVDVDMPNRGEAVQTAGEMIDAIKWTVLARDEKLIKTAATVRKRRVNGELND